MDCEACALIASNECEEFSRELLDILNFNKILFHLTVNDLTHTLAITFDTQLSRMILWYFWYGFNSGRKQPNINKVNMEL